MKGLSRPLAYAAVLLVIGVAYYLGRGGGDGSGSDLAGTMTPDPGYSARDAVIIETGYDGRERYRLNARVIRQQTDSGVIELEHLSMDYHPDAQDMLPGESAPAVTASGEVWHLSSDRGEMRVDGDDVELNGNVRVTGPSSDGGEPLSLSTESLRISPPTKYIETSAPVRLRWSGHWLDARGLQADLKAGTLRLESDVNGHFSPK
ncbi:MAG TPA: LPS export ABC transporter periplasmic protein LptC [Steroidobacteraceae bacterium]|nr:LPS export ABC transporter periplasmic protein LptC [Steroidobacteraceae bacterium]